jgi:hypothetical protein
MPQISDSRVTGEGGVDGSRVGRTGLELRTDNRKSLQWGGYNYPNLFCPIGYIKSTNSAAYIIKKF